MCPPGAIGHRGNIYLWLSLSLSFLSLSTPYYCLSHTRNLFLIGHHAHFITSWNMKLVAVYKVSVTVSKLQHQLRMWTIITVRDGGPKVAGDSSLLDTPRAQPAPSPRVWGRGNTPTITGIYHPLPSSLHCLCPFLPVNYIIVTIIIISVTNISFENKEDSF